MSLKYNPQTGQWRGTTYAEQTQAATRNAVIRKTFDSIRITKLGADGAPAGDSMTVTGRISIREEIRPDGRVPHPRYTDLFRDEEVVMYDATTRRTARIDANYHDNDQPGLPTVNHPCTLVFDTENGQQEEGPHSMYSSEAIQQAAYTLQQEREAREAAEIIDRIKAFGEDAYADGTVLRFSREFYKNRAKTQLHDPAVFSALRCTNEAGSTTWSDDTGTKRTWDELVTWFVTYGKPITLADVEIFPPAVFATTAGSGETRTVPAADL